MKGIGTIDFCFDSSVALISSRACRARPNVPNPVPVSVCLTLVVQCSRPLTYVSWIQSTASCPRRILNYSVALILSRLTPSTHTSPSTCFAKCAAFTAFIDPDVRLILHSFQWEHVRLTRRDRALEQPILTVSMSTRGVWTEMQENSSPLFHSMERIGKRTLHPFGNRLANFGF